METAQTHYVNGNALKGPYLDGFETAYFGMGCYWGAERLFWQVEGVWVTAVGFSGGYTPNPTYQESCTGLTGHAEVVMVVFDPKVVSYSALLQLFWEKHDPTQKDRQGNDVGTAYRSCIFCTSDEQLAQARQSCELYGEELKKNGLPAIVTQIQRLDEFYFAEADHQQYLAKNPAGYCGLRGTGVSCLL